MTQDAEPVQLNAGLFRNMQVSVLHRAAAIGPDLPREERGVGQPHAKSLASNLWSTANHIMDASKRTQVIRKPSDFSYLELKAKLSQDHIKFTALSNLMKTRHDFKTYSSAIFQINPQGRLFRRGLTSNPVGGKSEYFPKRKIVGIAPT
jgi:hypothetical protein